MFTYTIAGQTNKLIVNNFTQLIKVNKL